LEPSLLVFFENLESGLLALASVKKRIRGYGLTLVGVVLFLLDLLCFAVQALGGFVESFHPYEFI
jgi:hypothetical protein